MRRASLCLLLLLLSSLFVLPKRARAQEGLEVQDVNVEYTFGQQITFQGRLDSAASVSQASILFRGSEEQATRVEPLVMTADGRVHFTYDASLNVLPPFSTVFFWFQAAYTDGSTRASGTYSFRYDDNRFAWQKLSDPGLVLYWYDGDLAFGQSALDAARAGLAAVGQIVQLSVDPPLEIYIYASPQELQGALVLGGQDWVSGHADPALGVAMLAVPPGDTQGIEMQAKIPHEIAHVMLYRQLGARYNNLPVWLSEGIASLVEAYPQPDYANALEQASKQDSLIPIADLCDSFPPDSGRAFLAYAEAQSFTSFLRDSYGANGLSALISAYGDGVDCDLGASRALGVPLGKLDTRWREVILGQNLAGVALRNLLPYLVVLVLALLVPGWGILRMVQEKRKYERESG